MGQKNEKGQNETGQTVGIIGFLQKPGVKRGLARGQRPLALEQISAKERRWKCEG
jgi:hypothetical protein